MGPTGRRVSHLLCRAVFVISLDAPLILAGRDGLSVRVCEVDAERGATSACARGARESRAAA